MLLENGNRVFGVEPNADMRQAGEEYLAKYPNFTSVTGTAENTGLADHSVDLVTAAQAAHWFDREKALREFQRILKPGGYVALLWNDRRLEASPFDRDYEKMVLKYGTDYTDVNRFGKAADQFFGGLRFELRVLHELSGVRLRGAGRAAALFFLCAAGRASILRANAGGAAQNLRRLPIRREDTNGVRY